MDLSGMWIGVAPRTSTIKKIKIKIKILKEFGLHAQNILPFYVQ